MGLNNISLDNSMQKMGKCGYNQIIMWKNIWE